MMDNSMPNGKDMPGMPPAGADSTQSAGTEIQVNLSQMGVEGLNEGDQVTITGTVKSLGSGQDNVATIEILDVVGDGSQGADGVGAGAPTPKDSFKSMMAGQ